MKLKSIFKEPEDYSFISSPVIIRPKVKLLEGHYFQKHEIGVWRKNQRRFLKWFFSPIHRCPHKIKTTKNIRETIMRQFGFIRGNVLDVGGGWGVFRQWWENENNDIYIVHDPEFSTFVKGPTPLHYRIYREGFSKPITFVEGFGEKLPYHSSIFNECILSEILDHCLKPREVVMEVYRCLKQDGRLFLLNHITPKNRNVTSYVTSFINKLKKATLAKDNPFAFLSACMEKIKGNHHMHKLSTDIIIDLVKWAGFEIDISREFKFNGTTIYALNAYKKVG